MQIALALKYELEPIIDRAIRRGLISALEFIPEGVAHSPRTAEAMAERIKLFDLPVSLHFVSSSLGSADFIENNPCVPLARFARQVDPVMISEHLTCFRSGKINVETNLPVPRTDEMVELFTENIRHFKRIMKTRCPFLIENVPSYWDFNESTMGPSEFFAKVAERANCGLLLDLHNLYTDEMNCKVDGIEYIDSLPTDRIMEIHIAGGQWIKRAYIDSHSAGVPPRVFALLEHALKKSSPRLIVLEREGNFTRLESVLESLLKVNRICAKIHGKNFNKPSIAA